MSPIFRAIISTGKVVFDNLGLFNDYLTLLEGKNVDVIVRRHKKDRTLPQNRYLWAVCYKLISDHTGYTVDEIHDSMRAMFLIDNLGKFPVVRSTTSLDTVAFTAYVESIRQFASEDLGIVIPDPEEVDIASGEVKEYREQLAKDTEARKTQLVSPETLEELMGWVGKGSVTQANLMKLCSDNFGGREPRDLTQEECERLDTLIIEKLLNQ